MIHSISSSLWQPISSAPYDCEMELATIDYDGVPALAFPCRRVSDGSAKSEKFLD
jgi:hypothetical protein